MHFSSKLKETKQSIHSQITSGVFSSGLKMAYSKALLVLGLLSIVFLISSEVSARKLAESATTVKKDISMSCTSFRFFFWGGFWNFN